VLTTEEVLRADALRVSLGGHEVLHGIDIALGADRSVAVTGPSGSGKSTLLYALAGLERASSGSVSALGADLSLLDPDELSDLRLRRFGFVFQSADLVPELSLRENIALPLELAGARRSEVRARVDELVERLGLSGSASRRPSQVSGGQAQRAAVARAVVAGPAVVLADEPTGALDSGNRDAVLELLFEQVSRCRALLVLVTHDPDVAALCAEQVHLLDGRVVERAVVRG
jgi:putative ABC transport system ATP-binding protein